jgi:uncharacterized protein (TIGR02679 family)
VGHVDHERLKRLLGTPETAWVLDRARRRLERGQALDGTVTLTSATRGERDAVARLLGRSPRPARGLSVQLGELDAVLRRAGVHEEGLAGAVVTLTGPVTIRAEVASAEARAWASAFAPLDALARTRIELHLWTGRLRATGLVKRLAEGSASTGADLLGGVCRVIEALPCDPAQSLPAFSAQVLGRAHALDDGAPLGTLTLGAARALAGLGPIELGESLSEARREAWAAVGVMCDELSSVVLTLGLPGGASPSSSAMVLSAARTAGEPVWLTLRQLVRAAPVWEGITGASIVENPSVLALAADRLGPRCPPLICTHGQPRAATMVLLRSLVDAGVRLRHHGDFDWPGITIANLLHRRLPMDAWRYDAATYVEVAEAHPHTATLTGTPIAASWDPALARAMTATGRQIEEELVAPGLLEHLVHGPLPPPGIGV